jgi:hypothetical protein
VLYVGLPVLAQVFETLPFVPTVNPVVEPVSRSNEATSSSSACVVGPASVTDAAGWSY